MATVALSLAERFKDRPNIFTFVRFCGRIRSEDGSKILSQRKIQTLLDALDSVEFQLLVEILDQTRLDLEESHCYKEAAYWDLVADRVKHEIRVRF